MATQVEKFGFRIWLGFSGEIKSKEGIASHACQTLPSSFEPQPTLPHPLRARDPGTYRDRCVVSRKFDRAAARKRFAENGESCADDDGNLLKDESSNQFQYLEVAYILPHCLTTVASEDTDLSDSKKNALRILDMFDLGIIYLIDGPKIDSRINALTLTLDYYRLFGEFQIYFERTGTRHQYRIDSTERSPFLLDPLFPVTRLLTLSPYRTVDPPSSRLLDVHRAIALIMKLSGAGEYIESVLRDMEELNTGSRGVYMLRGLYRRTENLLARQRVQVYGV
ncbi:hypothetical protein POX_f07389 [Penicillium oxalicum]|uniref:hypothetical protein n=1 Tax=Penicillium oxalicum TaxID=69781 RepID=UPI0020B751FE|nr:hypothetical protein POX_f07389 [Penicillium oxalicum]KAI2787034.1 hypothetical protein POX_f07389 [Penicillium oxalicum]